MTDEDDGDDYGVDGDDYSVDFDDGDHYGVGSDGYSVDGDSYGAVGMMVIIMVKLEIMMIMVYMEMTVV